jgi:hypothetical protein
VAKQRSKFALAPFGDIAAPSSKSLCGVEKSGGKVTLTVNGGVPTLVTVRVTAPAVGDFRAFEQIEQVTVK